MRFLLANGHAAQWVAAEGRITEATPRDFAAFLAGLDSVPDTIVLNSPGGRLAAGLALGRAIRAEGLATRVGDSTECEDEDARVETGICTSSCAYAFLGGIRREIGQTGYLGFHQIYPAAGQPHLNAEVVQAATTEAMHGLRAYVEEMGANPILPDIAALVARDAVYIPQGDALIALRIETGAAQIANTEPALPARL